jgi:hypothetical protein
VLWLTKWLCEVLEPTPGMRVLDLEYRHERAVEASGYGAFPSDAQAIEEDHGQTLGFVRAIAARRALGRVRGAVPHVWEPAFGAICADLMLADARDRDQEKP